MTTYTHAAWILIRALGNGRYLHSVGFLEGQKSGARRYWYEGRVLPISLHQTATEDWQQAIHLARDMRELLRSMATTNRMRVAPYILIDATEPEDCLSGFLDPRALRFVPHPEQRKGADSAFVCVDQRAVRLCKPSAICESEHERLTSLSRASMRLVS